MAIKTHLTTAMLSGASTQFVQANAAFAGTNATGTIASNGISVSIVPQTAYVFSNSNGVSFGTNGSTVTATVKTDYITTAALSNHSHGNPTLALTNLSGTTGSNSAGLTLSLSANPAGGADGYNIIGVNGNSVALSATVQFSNSNNVSFGLAGSTVTATATFAQSADTNKAGIGFTSNTQAGTDFSATLNTAGLSMLVPKVLTTARASTDAIGLNTALTGNGVSVTANSSGLSINVPAFLTTAAQSNHSHGNPTLALTNLSGTTASASNGLTISLSAAAPGAGGGAAISGGANSQSTGTVNFANSNGITFGLSNNGTMTASHNGLTTARASTDGIGLNTAQSNVTWTVNSSGLSLDARGYAGTGTSATNASITLNSNGLAISVAAPGGGAAETITGWEVFQRGNNSTFSSMGQNTLYIQKLRPDNNYAFSNFELRASGSFVSSSNSQRVHYTINYGLYSLNGETYSSISTSGMNIQVSYNSTSAYGITVSQGAGSYTITSNNTNLASYLSGNKHLYLPFTSTLTAGGNYAFGFHISSASSVNTGPYRLAILNQTILNNLTIGKIHASTILASNASFVGDFAMGVGSVTTGAMPSSIAKSAMTNQVSQARLYMQLD